MDGGVAAARAAPEARWRAVAKPVRWGLGLFLILLLYDGALRKWAFPGFEQVLFIAKDALLLGVIAYALLNRPRQINASMPSGVRMLLLLYAGWVLLQAGNWHLPNLLVGIWGVKAHLLYAGLILLLPLAFRDLSQLYRWLVKAYPWVVVPVCAVAFLQLASPGDSFLNASLKGGTEGQAVFGESNLVRVTGTFSYISGMSSFVQTSVLLGMGLFLAGARSRSFLVGLGFALAALPVTGSRSVIVVSAIAALVMLSGAVAARVIGTKSAVRILMVGFMLGVLSIFAQDDAWVALQQRAERAGDAGTRFTDPVTNAFTFLDVAGAIGFGAGSANLGAPAFVKDLAPFSWLPVGNRFEAESGRLVLELGALGWVLSMAMRIALLAWALKLALKGRTRVVRLSGVLALPVMALGVYVGNGVFAPPIGASYYWFCVALLAMAQFEHRRALEQRARLRAERQLTAGSV